MAQSALLKSFSTAHRCASLRPLSRPLASWLHTGDTAVARSLHGRSVQAKGISSCSLLGLHHASSHPGKAYRRLLSTTPAAATAAADAAVTVPFAPSAPIQVSVSGAPPTQWEGDLLLIGVFQEDVPAAEGAEGAEAGQAESKLQVQQLDQQLQGALSDIFSLPGFTADAGSKSIVARVGGGSPVKYVACIGMGKAADFKGDAGTYKTLARTIVSLAKEHRFSSVALTLPSGDLAAQPLTAELLRASFESTHFKGVKTREKKDFKLPKLSQVELLVAPEKLDGSQQAAAVEAGVAWGQGSLLAMYLVDAPPNVCTPSHLAEAAAYLASRHPSLQLEVLEKEQCQAMGMGCYLGVAECSQEPPKFIHLTYTPPSGNVKRKIAVIGKGLTFDSGGYNLKAGPGSMIEMMKFDMGGAAATLGAANIVGALQPDNVEVHFIIASCENMVDGKGLRPGDVLTAANGKTVEVNNTDAEGRLTLADAMWFAQEKCGATSMVDAATLTGACIVALGPDVAGLFTPSDAMAAALEAASKTTGEKVWRMPMEAAYADQLKSSCADMKNTGSRWGGSITAALFLQEFVNKGVEWAHVDMAGPVWQDKTASPTGFGAQLLAQWTLTQAQEAAAQE